LIIAGVYLLIILFFIYKNGFFDIFVDKSISQAQFTIFFVFKCLAIPVFYYIYEIQYGGIENYDAGNFLRDSKIVNSIFYENPWEYIKVLLCVENDAPGTELYSKFISKTGNWDEGVSWRLLFNDNRSLIRIHSVIHFISFGSYFVHALISCLLGYIGIGLMYRSLKHFFISKEIWLFGAFVFLPNLWLFSGALLKEPLVLFNLGLIFYLTDQFFARNYFIVQKVFRLLVIGLLIYYLKPQISFTVFTFYFLYKLLETFQLRFKAIWYLSSVVVLVVLINLSFLMFKKTSMFSFINKKQIEFYDVARGGIFLKDSAKFVRLENKGANVINDGPNAKFIRIAWGVPYYYWEDSHQKDTLYCASNKDTVTEYRLVYSMVPARSGYSIASLKTNFGVVGTLFTAWFRALGFPFSFKGFMNVIVSLESLFLSLCLLLSFVGIFFVKEKNILLTFLFSSILLLILFGIATPNLGAIVRYRCVISPFIFISFLYIINHYEARGIRKPDH
jgi:hypothetical protein